jgi:hypothetical protein
LFFFFFFNLDILTLLYTFIMGKINFVQGLWLHLLISVFSKN